MRKSRLVTTITCCGAISALLGGCVASKKTKSDPTKNATAKNVSLTINANDVAGGKNAAEANWITSFVIPGYIAAQQAKGVSATVKFNGAGVDDEQYKTKLAAGRTATSSGYDAPLLLRVSDELVALGADGTMLVCPHGRRTAVRGDRASFAGHDGPHLIELDDRTVLSIAA